MHGFQTNLAHFFISNICSGRLKVKVTLEGQTIKWSLASVNIISSKCWFIQRCQTRIRVIPYSPYYKVYNSSCSQVGYDLIDHVQSLPEPIKATVSICKHILCDNESASCSGIDA